MQWYVSQNGKASGPFDDERLAQLIQWGKVTREAFICDEQSSAWISIRCSAFGALLPGEGDGPPEKEPASTASAGSSSSSNLEQRLAFGLLASCFLVAGVLMATV